MVELVLAKDWVRVRFPAPAQNEKSPVIAGDFSFCGGRENVGNIFVRESKPD